MRSWGFVSVPKLCHSTSLLTLQKRLAQVTGGKYELTVEAEFYVGFFLLISCSRHKVDVARGGRQRPR